ncbi:MAG: alkaline phosphatase family protein, partial [Planctomycetota bacterium]
MSHVRLLLISVLFAASASSANHVAHAAPPAEDLRLVLQITVDQLRGDTMTRFGDRFVEGGFRHLL